MANSLVSYKDFKVWMADAHLEVILYYIKGVIIDTVDSRRLDISAEEWFADYLTTIDFYLRGFLPGAVDLDLDKLDQEPSVKPIYLQILKATINKLMDEGCEISIVSLNRIEDMKPEDKVYWDKPLKTHGLITFLEGVSSELSK